MSEPEETMMRKETGFRRDTYSVCVKSVLDEGWIDALQLDEVATQRYYAGPPRTVLTIRIIDQAELLGLLNRLHNMGLTLLSIELRPPGTPG